MKCLEHSLRKRTWTQCIFPEAGGEAMKEEQVGDRWALPGEGWLPAKTDAHTETQ